jgi:RND family efflux transporter MFP subunit
MDTILQSAHRRRWAAASLAVLLLTVTGVTSVDPSAARPLAAEITGFTAPLREATLASTTPGRLAEILFNEGARVEAGAVVVRLDSAVQERRAALAEAQAESTLDADLAALRLVEARTAREHLETVADAAASAYERITARIAVQLAEVELARAEFRRQQAAREAGLQRALLDEYQIRAPFAGVVVEHLRKPGETAEEREGLVRLVQLDPLVVTLDCPLELAALTRIGTVVSVAPDEASGGARAATVAFVSPVADAASQTVRIKLNVPNADGVWIPGMRVRAAWPPADAPAAESPRNPRVGR